MRITLASIVLLIPLLAGAAVSKSPASAPASAPTSARATDDYRIIIDRNIFTRNRRAISRSTSIIRMGPATNMGTVLTGVAIQADEPVAFFEDVRSGETTKLAVGQSIEGGQIVSISLDSVEFKSGGMTRTVNLGENLQGVSAVFAAPPAAASVPAPATAATSQPAIDKNTADVIERLRQRRLQEMGQNSTNSTERVQQ